MKGRPLAVLVLGIVALATAFGNDRFGTIGSTYTVTASTVRYTFRLDSASFATEFVSKDTHVFAPRGRKMLLVRYTVGNPEKWALSLNKDLVQFGVIDDPTKTPSLGGARSLEFAVQRQELAPGKTYSDTAYVEIANENQTPQLLVRIGGGAETLRYDLSTRVKGQTGPFSIQHGLVAADDVSARMGETQPIGAFEMTLERVTLGRTPIRVMFKGGLADEISPSTEHRLLVANVRLKNRTKSDQGINGAMIVEVFDEAGMKGPLHTRMLDRTNAVLDDGVVKPGATTNIQVVFVLPKEFIPASITIYDEVGGRRSMTIKNLDKAGA